HEAHAGDPAELVLLGVVLGDRLIFGGVGFFRRRYGRGGGELPAEAAEVAGNVSRGERPARRIAGHPVPDVGEVGYGLWHEGGEPDRREKQREERVPTARGARRVGAGGQHSSRLLRPIILSPSPSCSRHSLSLRLSSGAITTRRRRSGN